MYNKTVNFVNKLEVVMFKRKFYEKMLEWKNNSNGKTAFMIEGARRIGKSTIAIEFAQKEYDDYLFLDFAIESNDVKNLFEKYMGNIDNFFRYLFILKNKELKENSVIIFDEVQMFPLARQSIKYLVQDGRFHYIETGSLISVKKKSKEILIPSEEQREKMFPMDFEEFLWATGDTQTAKLIYESFENKNPLPDAIHRKIMEKFRTYMVIGGMPQAVNSFIEGESFKQIDLIKKSILNLYEEDLEKHDEEFTDRASLIFNTIPEQLSNHNSIFKFSKINKNARYKNYVSSVKFINDSMIGNFCQNVTDPEITLDLFAQSEKFKLYLGDTGLLVTQILNNSTSTDENIYKSIIFGKLGTNLGMIFENIVAQMLRVKGYKLFFHEFMYKNENSKSEKKYEIDFLIIKNKKICPIEVKSSSYKKHESFDNFYKKYKIKNNEKYIIYTKNLNQEDGITYLPIYMTMCL